LTLENIKLDIDYVRSQFPAFTDPLSKDWSFFENAGGSYVPKNVIDKLTEFMTSTKVQPYAEYPMSKIAGENMDKATNLFAKMINAKSNEILIGGSTSINLYVLSNALKHIINPGDEVIVTNQDHEANIGAWRKLSEHGIKINEWKFNPDSAELELDELKNLITEKTKFICVCHTSNVVASINNLKDIITLAHQNNIKVVGDGVAYMAHDIADLKDLDIDFYGFSLYKTYGPHLALLYGKRDLLLETKNLNHEFLEGSVPYTLNPGGPNHEELGCLSGITDYYETLYDHHFGENNLDLHRKGKKVFELVSKHEEVLMKELIDFLKTKKSIRMIGKQTHARCDRMPTVSFTVKDKSSLHVAQEAGRNNIGIRNGEFYAWRCLQGLGIEPNDGVVRVSMVHYNSIEEVRKLIGFLDKTI